MLWQARASRRAAAFPPAHPFNPLAALRLCIAGGCTVAAVDAIFDWIWRDGHAADSDAALAPLLDRLGIAPDAIAAAETKAALRANTEAALAAGVFGVPTLQVGDALFWGNDAHAFALAALHDTGGARRSADAARVASCPSRMSRLP